MLNKLLFWRSKNAPQKLPEPSAPAVAIETLERHYEAAKSQSQGIEKEQRRLAGEQRNLAQRRAVSDGQCKALRALIEEIGEGQQLGI